MKRIIATISLICVLALALSACSWMLPPLNSNPQNPGEQTPSNPQNPTEPSSPTDPTTPTDPSTPTTPDEPKLTQSKVEFVSPPTQCQLYTTATVKVENTNLPLYLVKVNNEHTWQPNPTTSRSDCGVGYFNLEGKTKVSVSVPGMQSCVVRPLSAGITAMVQNGVATFTVSSAGDYSVEPNGDATKAILLFVGNLQANPTATGNVIRFEKGLHTASSSRYISGDNTVSLGSNTTVILEEGAVVRARFVADNAQNVTICGRGIIDGSTFDRNAETGSVTVPLDFNFCKNVTLKDFSVLDPAGWCVNWYFTTDSHIDGIKIITSRSNGDGISLQSCKNIIVENCFLRTWDDTLVVKNYPQWANKNNEGSTQDITFQNCTLWTDLAQSMEVGYETVGTLMSGVTFKDITVLHNFHKPVMSIHNGNNANITNVRFENITVEDASMGRGDAGSNCQLCEFAVEFNSLWSTNHKTTALGSINTVVVKNVTVLAGNTYLPIRIAGSQDQRSEYNNSVHKVSNVTFENVWVRGKKLVNSDINKNSYVDGVTVTDGEQQITVNFGFSQTAEQLAGYTDTATVTVK